MTKGQSKQVLLIRKITKFDGFHNSLDTISTYFWQLNIDTHIPWFSISPLIFSKGWQNPISCDDEPDGSWLWETITFACEGYEQRILPTRVATGWTIIVPINEIDGAPEFQPKAFSEDGTFCKSKMGMDTTKWLQLAKDMLPERGVPRGGREAGKIFVFPHKWIWELSVINYF